MAFSSTKLMSLANELTIDFGVGPCLGFDTVLAMAYLSDQQDEFNHLLDTIGRYDDMAVLAADINETRLRVGLGKVKDGDKLLISIYDFLTSIARINLLQSQVFQYSFAYQEYQKEKLLFSNSMQEKGGLKSQEENLILRKDEAKNLFLDLQKFAKKYPKICFCIESHDHDIFMRYNVSMKCWQLTDINDFEEETDAYYLDYNEEDLADEVFACLDDDDISLMRIKLIAPSTAFTTNFLSDFKRCLSKFAEMNTQRAQMTNADDVGLLYLEAYRGDLGNVKRLLTLGAEPGKTSISKGLSPAHVACQNGHLEVIKALFKTNEQDINQEALDGNTLLLIACYNKYWHIVRYLLALEGINVNLANEKGVTPLHLLIIHQQTELCKLLLELGADKTAIASEMGTPLEVAEVIKNEGIMALLIEQEPDEENLSAPAAPTSAKFESGVLVY